MPLPNLAPPFAKDAPLNCTFKIKNNVASGGSNALGNPVITFTETEVSGWAVRLINEPQLLQTIGANVEEVPIKVWIQDPASLPANFASFQNVKCDLTLSGILQRGIFRPVPMGHPFPVPQFVIGAFKGAIAT